MRRVWRRCRCAGPSGGGTWDVDKHEPSGCAAFKWPIDRERALLTAEPASVASGAELQAVPATAIALKLHPAADAALPAPPERAPAPDRYAGFVRIKQIAKAGTYTIALSAAAALIHWCIDDRPVEKPEASFSS